MALAEEGAISPVAVARRIVREALRERCVLDRPPRCSPRSGQQVEDGSSNPADHSHAGSLSESVAYRNRLNRSEVVRGVLPHATRHPITHENLHRVPPEKRTVRWSVRITHSHNAHIQRVAQLLHCSETDVAAALLTSTAARNHFLQHLQQPLNSTGEAARACPGRGTTPKSNQSRSTTQPLHISGPPEVWSGISMIAITTPARHVLDQFHAVRWFTQELTLVRRELQRRQPPGVKPACEPDLFRARFALLKRHDHLSGAEQKRLDRPFDTHPRLQVAWDVLQELYGLYQADDLEGTLEALERFAGCLCHRSDPRVPQHREHHPQLVNRDPSLAPMARPPRPPVIVGTG